MTNTPQKSEFHGSLTHAPFVHKQWLLAGNRAYFFDTLVKEFGDFVRYRGLFNFYLINHPSLVRQVLMETHKTFDKRSAIYRRFANVFGRGLVVAEGQQWKRQRRLMQPLFGPVAVQKYFGLMVAAIEEMLLGWERRFRNSEVFDVAPEMKTLTLHIAGQALFSDGFRDSAQRIAEWTEVINRYAAKPPIPIVRDFWFPSPVNFRLKTALKEFHHFISELIERRSAGGHEDDLLAILLASRHEDTGEPMSREELIDEVLGMIIGGHETSSSALTWVWYELAQNPSVAERLRAEIDTVLQGRIPSLEDLPKLRYTRMVIDETLRLHPPFWFENRNVTEETELGGAVLPKGSLVVFSRYSLHRHPDFWQDPERFDPERHDPDHPENTRASHALIPFGGGPRICIGINFALMELVLAVAMTTQRWHLRVARDTRHEMAARLTMEPKFGLRVSLEPRGVSRPNFI